MKKFIILILSFILFYIDLCSFNKDHILRVRLLNHKIDLLRVKGLGDGLIDPRERDFRAFNLSGSDLSYLGLSKTIFIGADLSSADLSNTDLSFANLTGANLNKANLIGVIFYKTIIDGADLTEARMSAEQKEYAIAHGAICDPEDIIFSDNKIFEEQEEYGPRKRIGFLDQ